MHIYNTQHKYAQNKIAKTTSQNTTTTYTQHCKTHIKQNAYKTQHTHTDTDTT